MTPLSDLELLELEIETLWQKDDRDRLIYDLGANRFAPHLVIAVSNAGWMLTLGSEVSAALAAELQAAVAGEPPTSDPAAQPAVIARCEQLLGDSLGPLELSCSLGYVILGQITFASAAEILRSDDANMELLQRQDIERLNWSPEDWRQLLDGALGPWAMAVIDRQVVAICHSARFTDRATEAGVWTDPDFRGQGHAAAVTAAWSSLLVRSGRQLFYSTSSTNISSQRVAARLNLRRIGWMWKLSHPRES